MIAALAVSLWIAAAEPQPAPLQTMTTVIEQSKATDWRTPDDDYVLYLELKSGRVVIELAPKFAPNHVRNVIKLARQKYFDGLAIVRVQENYVVQWGDPLATDPNKARSLGEAKTRLTAEFATVGTDLKFMQLPTLDAYADQVGFVDGFPAARDGASGKTWLAHCYGMVGAGRQESLASGNGGELYVVIGHAPRHLDRNVTLLGRVLKGMELLTTLPRGRGDLGFYESPRKHVKIRSIRVASDVKQKDRERLEVFRTDRPAFYQLIDSRANRRESWFAHPVGRIGLCNVPIPVREARDQ